MNYRKTINTYIKSYCCRTTERSRGTEVTNKKTDIKERERMKERKRRRERDKEKESERERE
jgi:hypothetical protein